ncbi:MAG: hypothetical protein WCK35_01610 [Chloroflexota bacterium]
MAIEKENETDEMVRCILCSNQVWLRKDRLEKHIGKVHSPNTSPKKTFTTYHARIESNFPPKISSKPKALEARGRGELESIRLLSQNGQRIDKGCCAECGLDGVVVWHYVESNLGSVDICRSCKVNVFERSFGKLNLELPEHAV